MFVERLVAGLSAPQNRLGELDDALVIDVDHYRALLMREARAISESGETERAVAGWAFTCIAEGWVDDHLHTVRDSLIELGAIADQAHLDRLLHAAVLRILGIEAPLDGADALVLDTVTRPTAPPGTLDAEPLGLRLLVRHYAMEVGLLSRASGQTERTALGDTALRLPRHNLPAYLLALEMLQSAGLGDRWRTPRRALGYMAEAREFDIPTSSQSRRQIDPEGLVPWRRVRRLALMGLCEAVGLQGGDEEDERCRYRLLPYGEEVLRLVLREPPSEVVRLAQALLAEQTRQALRPLLVRSRAIDALRFARDGVPRKEASEQGLAATMRPAVSVAQAPQGPPPQGPPPPSGPSGGRQGARRSAPERTESPRAAAPEPGPLQAGASASSPQAGPVLSSAGTAPLVTAVHEPRPATFAGGEQRSQRPASARELPVPAAPPSHAVPIVVPVAAPLVVAAPASALTSVPAPPAPLTPVGAAVVPLPAPAAGPGSAAAARPQAEIVVEISLPEPVVELSLPRRSPLLAEEPAPSPVAQRAPGVDPGALEAAIALAELAAEPVLMEIKAPPVAEHRSPDSELQSLAAQVEAGQPELELSSLVQRAWEEIQARQVRFSLQGPPLRVLGDRRALLQALRELLRSAADAALLGAMPAVTVEVLAGEDEAALLVHDNGPPLSAADRDSVLDVSWGLLTEGPRTGLLRAHRVLRSQGLALQLPPSKLGGTTAKVQLTRVRGARRAAA